MRTNIDIDDALLAEAMKAGPYTTKKETVEAGLRLLARQAAYREILKWRGKLKWEGDESVDWTRPDAKADEALLTEGAALAVEEPRTPYRTAPSAAPPKRLTARTVSKAPRRAGR